MKSRRRIAFLKAQDHANYVIAAEICDRRNGANDQLRCRNFESPMSALCQKQTLVPSTDGQRLLTER